MGENKFLPERPKHGARRFPVNKPEYLPVVRAASEATHEWHRVGTIFTSTLFQTFVYDESEAGGNWQPCLCKGCLHDLILASEDLTNALKALQKLAQVTEGDVMP